MGRPQGNEPEPAWASLPAVTLSLVVPAEGFHRPNGQRYLPRDLGGLPDVLVLRSLKAQAQHVLLFGDPGVGKTALVEAAFADLVTVQCTGDMVVSHLVGSHLPRANGTWEWHDGPLVTAMREGRNLYLDEVDAMPHEVSTVLHAVMDGRGQMTIEDLPGADPVVAHPDFYVIAAYNPGRGRSRRPSEAIMSRFTVQVQVTTDYDAARSLGVYEPLVSAAENLTLRSLHDIKSGGLGIWAPQMRELLAAQRLIDGGLGTEFAAGAMIAQCPWPEDIEEVLDVVEHVLGVRVQPLRLGRQV